MPLVSLRSRSTNPGNPDRSWPLLSRPARRPARPRLAGDPLAARTVPRPAPQPERSVRPAGLIIDELIRQWVEANPPQLYRGGA